MRPSTSLETREGKRRGQLPERERRRDDEEMRIDLLGKIVRVLDFDCDLNDGRDGELHDSHVVTL